MNLEELELALQIRIFVLKVSIIGSVADPWHFRVDPHPEPRIHASD